MGYMFAYGTCFACHQPFTFNPNTVPSIRDSNNVRQPVCRNCMEQANNIRVARGEAPHYIAPDAYKPTEE